jgi:hypothetical protein
MIPFKHFFIQWICLHSLLDAECGEKGSDYGAYMDGAQMGWLEKKYKKLSEFIHRTIGEKDQIVLRGLFSSVCQNIGTDRFRHRSSGGKIFHGIQRLGVQLASLVLHSSDGINNCIGLRGLDDGGCLCPADNFLGSSVF